MLSSEAMISKLEGTGDYKVLRRLLVHDHYDHRLPDDEIRNGIVLDVETTWLDTDHDAIIEIALVPFTFSSDGRMFDVGAAYHGFQEPPEPLSEEIVALTGLTDEVLKGQGFAQDAVIDIGYMHDVTVRQATPGSLWYAVQGDVGAWHGDAGELGL